MKKFLIAVGVLALLSGMGTMLQARSESRPGCWSTQVIRCGVINQTDLQNGLNKHADAKKLYQSLGIPSSLSQAKEGVLYPQTGEVKVGGEVVATNAYSYGRTKTTNDNFKKWTAKQAFSGYKSTPVYVFFNADGSFKVAVAKICGNPITGTPKVKPEYNCKNLTVDKISRTKFKFNAAYHAKRATHVSTTYVVTDAAGKVVHNSTDANFATEKPGTYTVKAKVTFKVNGKNVTVEDKDCIKKFTVEKPPVSYSCKNLAVTKISRTEFKFATEYTVQNATKKTITYVVTDANGKEVYKGYNDTFTTNTPGAYTVRAHVSFEVDGQIKTATSDNCVKQFNVEKPPVKDIKVCELATKKVITIKEDQFDATKHSKNLDDCKEVVVNIEVCELATKKVITINEKDFDATKHSKDLEDCKEVVVRDIEVCELETKKVITIKENEFDATKHSKDLKDCEEVEVETIEVCELATKEIVTINKDEFDETKHSMDATDCEEVPVTPETPVTPEAPVVTELPKTGNEFIASGLGLGALIAAVSYYGASRRALR